MAPRLLIVRARRADALPGLEAAALSDGMIVRHRSSGTLILSDRVPSVVLPNERGFVFGDLFDRAEHRRVDSIAVDAAVDMIASRGRSLVEQYWGDYIAVVLRPDDEIQIVRSPFGAMAAFRLQVADADIISNDVGLLIDQGWFTPAVDWEFAAHFLAFPFHRSTRTGFVGLTEIPAGVGLSMSSASNVETTLWSPWEHVRPIEDGDLPARLRDLTRRCVRGWAEGRGRLILELSGGLDSSILAACLWDSAADVLCVNMVSPALDGDERLFARAVAERTGLPLQEIALDPRALDLTAPPSIRRPRPSAHALLGSWDRSLADLAQQVGADAFVSGGGGDNVFFNTHGSTPAADALRRGALSTWCSAIGDLVELHGCSAWQAATMSVRRATESVDRPWRPDRRFLSPGAANLSADPHPWRSRPKSALPGKIDHIKGLMEAQNYLDAFPRSTHAPLLTPLLSQPIVELCLSIPSWDWIRGGQDRAIAREAFRASLPPAVVGRRSKGNLAGFAGPAFEAARAKLASHLLDGRLLEAGLLDADAIHGVLTDDGPPKGSDYFRILQIADVESWARRWT